MGYVIMLCWKLTAECVGERICQSQRQTCGGPFYEHVYKPHACYNAVVAGQSTVGVHRVDYVACVLDTEAR